jgi:hypothetical protein
MLVSGAVLVAAQLLRRAVRTAPPQPDEMQQLLTLLCERLHEHLQQDETPPRAVINLTARQSHEVSKSRPTTSDHAVTQNWEDERQQRNCGI